MSEPLRTIAVFDFDGTLTHRDTLPLFIKHTHGRVRYLLGLIICLPWIVAYKLGLYNNGKAKEHLFAHFYKGMDYDIFRNMGETFSEKIETWQNKPVINILKDHKKHSHKIYVVSASLEEWVLPWCNKHGVDYVLATKAMVDCNNKLTGQFLTQNCYGTEKVRRFKEVEPMRNEYELYVYGDSRGDWKLMEFADHPVYVGQLPVNKDE